jgi:Icc-related predicted phosphoesterase
MKIAFLGDLHGRVFHALALIVAWQATMAEPLDLVIQVGDMGAFPHAEAMLKDEATRRYAAEDPAELGFCQLLQAEGALAESLRSIRQRLPGPIYFLRGNHEDVSWLRGLFQQGQKQTVGVDPFDLFHYVTDGVILEHNRVKIAFFGGVENPEPGQVDAEHDRNAYTHLLHMGAGAFDILVTHDPPYGISTGYQGQVQGSSRVLDLIEVVQPKYHIAGHLHTVLGSRQYGATTYIGLSGILLLKRQVSSRIFQSGCMAILDTLAGTLDFANDDWLSVFDQDFVFETFVEKLT